MTSADNDREQRNAALARKYEAIAPQYGYHARKVLQAGGDDERLTIPQFRALQTLKKLGDPGATNLDLARSISVSPPAMTAMIDGLVDRGFVTRTTDPGNRRQVLILLTDAGEARLHAASRSIEHSLAKGMSILTESEAADLANGLNALGKVFAHLSEIEQD